MPGIIPNDPEWWRQTGLFDIQVPQGWDYSEGSSSVIITILDTGIDLPHPDLMTKLVPGFNILSPSALPQDDNGYGSLVAGDAAAVTNNGEGIAGVSWGARLMPVKVLNSSGKYIFLNVANGIW